MKAYKLFRIRKDGTLGSLFIDRKQRIPIGVWLKANTIPTKGYTLRPGFHACCQPSAPHLSTKKRTWYEVELREVVVLARPKHQGGNWLIAKYMKVIGRV